MALIAQAATLRSRIPFIHFFDGFRTSHEVNKIHFLNDEQIRAMIDDDLVIEHRRRGLDPSRPFPRIQNKSLNFIVRLEGIDAFGREADQAIAALAQGEVAAVIAPLSQLEAGLGPERGRMEIVDNLFDGLAVTHWPIGCAVRENARDLGYAVGDIMAAAVRDGRIAAIFARHGVTWHSPAAAE